MTTERVAIIALGASTAVGRDAWSSAAAVRAGISGFVRPAHLVDRSGEPVSVAAAPWLAPDLAGADRLEALLFPAIEQVLAPLDADGVGAHRTAVALGLPDARPGLPDDLERDLIGRTGRRFGGRLGRIAGFAAGHAAGLIAMRAATARLACGALDACVVAGVDSYLHTATLESLEAQDQLHGAGPLNNAWGFIPGEAAGALLLMRESIASAVGVEAFATVLGSGEAIEGKGPKTRTVCIGEGLTTAFREALVALPMGERVADIYCDMNGEPHRADEFGFAVTRSGPWFAAASDFVAPADCWGDVAAAGGVLHVLLACIASRKGYAKGRYALAFAGSERGARSTVLLDCGAARA